MFLFILFIIIIIVNILFYFIFLSTEHTGHSESDCNERSHVMKLRDLTKLRKERA